MIDVIRRNNVRVIGKGENAMLFAHGLGFDQSTWLPMVKNFEETHKIILFDYVGAGKSDTSSFDYEKYSTLNGYATDVLDICEALDLKNVVYVGHSVSSMIGALAAIRQPAYFKKLVFIGPSARYINDNDYRGGMEQEDLNSLLEVMESNYFSWSQMVAPTLMGNEDRPTLAEGLADGLTALDPEIAKSFARATFHSDNRVILPLLEVESLSITTHNDMLTPEEASIYIQKNARNNSRVVINAFGHCPQVSAPYEVVNAIKMYLN